MAFPQFSLPTSLLRRRMNSPMKPNAIDTDLGPI
jgi:hypothetical protein